MMNGNGGSMRDVTRVIKEQNVAFLDLKFIDLPGSLQHITLPIESFTEKLFMDGVGFDGSSVRGFQRINESDMLIKPDPATMFIDPFMDEPTLSFLSNIKDPLTHQIYSRDARAVTQRAERYLQQTGFADTAYFGPELEFYIFDDIRYDQTYNHGYYYVDSQEGFWNTGREENPNLGYKPGNKQGYFRALPTDTYHNLRSKMMTMLRETGVEAEVHHHEVASAGQSEIVIRYNTPVNICDSIVKHKYITKNVARRYKKTVTFMPKPLFMDNGSGMHLHISLWKGGRNLFYQPGRYGELSDLATHFVGGLLHHAPALCGICAPTTNSYRRLVPGYEAPINLIYSQRNRSACVRVPVVGSSEKAKRIEFRSPDASSNPYLAVAAILMAGIDGIKQRIQPPDPIDEDLYEYLHGHTNGHKIRNTPGSLEEAVEALRADHDFLTQGGVFSPDLLDVWMEYKRLREIDYIRLRPHPGEFALYYDA